MTQLLVDNQLPVALARFLHGNGWEGIHVQDVGLEAADDRAIWQYALERNLTIVTKDEDFQAIANRQGSIPPQVVWVRLGNCRNRHCWKRFRASCRPCARLWLRVMQWSRFDKGS